MILRYILLVFLFSSLTLSAQIAPNYYAVIFTDKDDNPFTLDEPEAFLTQRSIDRRNNQGIAYNNTDLPITPSYVQQVAEIGVEVWHRVKWINTLVIKTTDESLLDEINALPFVLEVSKIADINEYPPLNKKSFFEVEEQIGSVSMEDNNTKSISSLDYGNALAQIELINGVPLHDAGFQGQGMVIAVLDGGFYGVPERKVFDSLYANNQILGARDFASENNNPFEGSTHGTKVLSTMGANWPGAMIGTAPKASYWLLRTEYTDYENIIEEYNWLVGAAFADSVGADIINSSLGYNTFDDSNMDHSWSDLDGNTAIVTIGADLAAAKGILVVNSAGNEGGNDWQYITCPADGDSVFAIGAVEYNGTLAYFSSRGRPEDPRIKPNICAVGSNTIVADPYWDGITSSSGTSFSSPTIAGMTACLWQAIPELNNKQIMEAIEWSSSQYNNPDNDYGYGIPDYQLAYIMVDVKKISSDGNNLMVYPNPAKDILFLENLTDHMVVEIYDINGKLVYLNSSQSNTVNVNHLHSGVYILKVVTANHVETIRFLKE